MVEQAMEAKIGFVELLGTQKKGTFDNLPLETEYLIIGLLRDEIEKGSLKNLPLGLKKIVITDYDKSITLYSGYLNVIEYFNHITDGKIPFGCKIETIVDDEDYRETVGFFEALCDFEDQGERFFELNRLVEKGTYDYTFYNWKGEEVERDFLKFKGKKVYFSIDIE